MSGRLEWIGISTGPRSTIDMVESIEAIEGKGLAGDYHAKSRMSRRQVTLIQLEDLERFAQALNRPDVAPELLRRNLVVSGIALATLKRETFQIGDVLLQGTGDCPPCSRMDEALGMGGKKTMRGRGGITARVLKSGLLRIGDSVAIAHSTPLFSVADET